MQITLKMKPDIANLRRREVYRKIEGCLRAAAAGTDAPICDISVQNDHVHMMVDAANSKALTSAVPGVSIRIAPQAAWIAVTPKQLDVTRQILEAKRQRGCGAKAWHGRLGAAGLGSTKQPQKQSGTWRDDEGSARRHRRIALRRSDAAVPAVLAVLAVLHCFGAAVTTRGRDGARRRCSSTVTCGGAAQLVVPQCVCGCAANRSALVRSATLLHRKHL